MKKVTYLGRKFPLKLKMPWLEAGPYVFSEAGDSREMTECDAIRLLQENPRGFVITDAAEEVDDIYGDVAAPDTSTPEAASKDQPALSKDVDDIYGDIVSESTESNDKKVRFEQLENGRFKCQFCKKDYATEANAELHIKEKHDQQNSQG